MVYIQPEFSQLVGKYISPFIGAVLVIGVAVFVGLLSLFLLHSVTIWLSTNPETAFHKARNFAAYTSMGWNSLRSMYNPAKKMAFFWVPSWNTFAKHSVEPVINIGLDVISIVFAGHHFEGVIQDNTGPGGVPFRGHYCGNAIRNADGSVGGFEKRTETTTKYCSFEAAALWAGELGATESADPLNAIVNSSTLLFSTAHARKLQSFFEEGATDALLEEGASIFPAMNIGPLLEGIREITGLQAMIDTTILDITMHVAYTIFTELAVVMFNIIQIVVRAVAAVVMSLVASGALQTLIRTGLDLLMALVIHVALPLLFAVMDLILCLINFIQPATWAGQLQCVQQVCFQESGDIGAEIFTTFCSLPIITKAISNAVEALINPSTGRKYGEAAEGATQTPDLGETALPTVAAATCAACFSCRVPEVRAIWLLVAMTCKLNTL